MSKRFIEEEAGKLLTISDSVEDIVWQIERGKICLRKAGELLDDVSRLVKEWQDASRTYLPGEHQLDVRIDCDVERREAA